MNNLIFFQHPDLMRLLTVHENVMSIMINVLTAQQGAADHGEHPEYVENIEEIANTQESKVEAILWQCFNQNDESDLNGRERTTDRIS